MGIYEIGCSIFFNRIGKALPDKHQNALEYINATNNTTYKNELIDYVIFDKIIKESDVKKLY